MRVRHVPFFRSAIWLVAGLLTICSIPGCPHPSEGEGEGEGQAEGEGEGEECPPDDSILPEYYYLHPDPTNPENMARADLKLHTDMIAVRFDPSLPAESRQEIYAFVTILEPYDERCIECVFDRDELLGQTVGFTKPCTSAAQVLGAIETLNHLPGVQFSTPVYRLTDTSYHRDSEVYLLDTFYVGVYDTMPDESVRTFGEQFRVQVDQVTDYSAIGRRGYHLRIPVIAPMDTLELSNLYAQQDWVHSAEPFFGCISGCDGPLDSR